MAGRRSRFAFWDEEPGSRALRRRCGSSRLRPLQQTELRGRPAGQPLPARREAGVTTAHRRSCRSRPERDKSESLPPTPRAKPARRGVTASRRWVRANDLTALILVVILLVRLQLRLNHVNWDEGQHLHPDERFLSIVSAQIAGPDSVGQYFDSEQVAAQPVQVQRHLRLRHLPAVPQQGRRRVARPRPGRLDALDGRPVARRRCGRFGRQHGEPERHLHLRRRLQQQPGRPRALGAGRRRSRSRWCSSWGACSSTGASGCWRRRCSR